jgi:hypothetical protein
MQKSKIEAEGRINPRRRPVLAFWLPGQVAEVSAPLAGQRIAASAGAELVKHVVEGGAPKRAVLSPLAVARDLLSG